MVMTRTVYRVSFDPRPIRVNTEAGDGGTSTKSVTFLHCEFDARPIRVHKDMDKKGRFLFYAFDFAKRGLVVSLDSIVLVLGSSCSVLMNNKRKRGFKANIGVVCSLINGSAAADFIYTHCIIYTLQTLYALQANLQ